MSESNSFRENSLDRFMDAFWDNQGGAECSAEWDQEAEPVETAQAAVWQGGVQGIQKRKKLGARTWVSLFLLLAALPVLLCVATFVFHGRKYLAVSLVMVAMATAPFALIFEGRKPQAREVVILAVLAALAVAGRAAFFMLPQFKPMAAMVLLSGVAFGGEAGFLVGAVSAVASNMFMGQGPWTPWQMFAFGVVGFLAGVLFRPGRIPPKTPALCVYGFFSVFFLYGFIMNTASLFMSANNDISLAMLLTLLISGVPMDLVHAGATVFFLAILARPVLEKLQRVKVKYGLMEAG